MKTDTLTPRQLMLSPDLLAYELGQIPTPEKIENTQKATYLLLGALAVVSIGVIVASMIVTYQDNKKDLN